MASALRIAGPERLSELRLRGEDSTAAVFKLGRKRLYELARELGVLLAVGRK